MASIVAPIPKDFLCPILHEVMDDPVITMDGQTYERRAITHWFAMGRTTSPSTGADLPATMLVANVALRNSIQSFMASRPDLRFEPPKMSLEDVKVAVEALEAESAGKRQGLVERVASLEAEIANLRSQLAAARRQDGGVSSIAAASSRAGPPTSFGERQVITIVVLIRKWRMGYRSGWGSKKIKLRVSAGATGADLKAMIEAKEGIPHHRQSLYSRPGFKTRLVFANRHTLNDHKIKDREMLSCWESSPRRPNPLNPGIAAGPERPGHEVDLDAL